MKVTVKIKIQELATELTWPQLILEDDTDVD
jgi:hypothetical protein